MKGQSLIEILVALAIAGIIIAAVTVSITSALSNAQYSKTQNLATNYAEEAMEIVRKIRNSDYAAFTTYSGIYCLGNEATSLGSPVGACTTPNVDTFIRSVQIQQNSGCSVNGARVTVVVSWKDGKCQSGNYCHESRLVSCLSTMNPVQGP